MLSEAIEMPVIPVQKDIPLYGPSGQPEENEIQQGMTPDCFLEASVAAIIRTDIKTITGMLGQPGDHHKINVTLHNPNGDEQKFEADLKNFNDRFVTKDSKCSWLAVIEDGYSQLLDSTGSPDVIHNGKGSWPELVLKAIYGPKVNVVTVDCTYIQSIGEKATSKPATFCTKHEDGQLIGGHAYTIHSANSTHLTLRNPWGIVNKNDWDKQVTGGKDVRDLGNGVLEIPISVAQEQCVALTYADIVTPAEISSSSLSSWSAVYSTLMKSESNAVASAEAEAEAAVAAATMDGTSGNVYTFSTLSESGSVSKRSVARHTPTMTRS